MKRKLGVLVLALFCTGKVWADFSCPTNFNSVEVGESVDAVEKACGKADNKTVTKKTPFQAQEWIYYVQSYPGMTGTLKTTVAFDKNQQVINISVNGAGESQTQICGQTNTIQFGMSPKQIEAACGKPTYIQKTSADIEPPKTVEETQLKYNGPPNATFIFEDDKLTSRDGG